MLYRSLSRVVATSFLGLAGMSLGCGDSPSSPTPGPPAPSSPTPVGFALTSVSPSSGPTVGGDYIRLFGVGFQSGATVLLDGVAVPVTKVWVDENVRPAAGTAIDARTLAHAAGTVDVVVTNPENVGSDTGVGIFDAPNRTSANNGLRGISCRVGRYDNGRLGTLNGNSGAKSFGTSCIDSLDQPDTF